MKRDLDLLRDILLEVEDWNDPQPLRFEALAYDGKTQQEIGYHLELLEDAGYIDADISKWNSGAYARALILRMTMAGHDYLDSVRSPEVWNKTKTALEKVGGGAALDVVKDVASKILAELIRIHTGL
jgi:DNA-binding transcriptional ArsR family regulator